MKRESTFTTAFKQSLLESGERIFFHKLTDLPHFKGSKTRFDAKKPFDAFMVHRFTPVAIEFKVSMGFYGAFPMNKIADHQKEALSDFAEAGGKSFLVLHLFNNGGKTKKLNGFVFWPWDEIKGRENSVLKKELLEKRFYSGSYAKGYPVIEFIKSI